MKKRKKWLISGLLLVVFIIGTMQLAQLNKTNTLRLEQEAWVKEHERQIFDELCRDLDPKKEHIKTIHLDYSAVYGSWQSDGDAGGIPYPYKYWIAITAYLNGDKDYQLEIEIKLNDTTGNRIFKTRINPFEKQTSKLESFTTYFNYKNAINKNKWDWKIEQDRIEEKKQRAADQKKEEQLTAETNKEKAITKEWVDKYHNNIVTALNTANIYRTETGDIVGYEVIQVDSDYQFLVNLKFDKIPDFSIDYKLRIKFEDEKNITTDQGAMISASKYRLGDGKGTELYLKGPTRIDIYDEYQSNYMKTCFPLISKLDTTEVFIQKAEKIQSSETTTDSERYYFKVTE